MPVSNPIPSNQIVDINLEWTCGNEPECPTLDNVLQAIIEEVCDKEPMIDLNELTFDACFNGNVVPGNTTELLQAIVNDIAALACPDVEAPDVDISGLNLCDDDNWNCSSEVQCIPMVDECGNPVEAFTIKQLFQAMIARMMAYQDQICGLEDRVTQLEDDYTDLAAEIEVIKTNCCDITLINRIIALEEYNIANP